MIIWDIFTVFENDSQGRDLYGEQSGNEKEPNGISVHFLTKVDGKVDAIPK